MLDCASASRFPKTIVTTARMAKSPDQSCCRSTDPNEVYMMRMTTANADAFDAVERNADTGVGAPW